MPSKEVPKIKILNDLRMADVWMTAVANAKKEAREYVRDIHVYKSEKAAALTTELRILLNRRRINPKSIIIPKKPGSRNVPTDRYR
jgi:hypothetical protein